MALLAVALLGCGGPSTPSLPPIPDAAAAPADVAVAPADVAVAPADVAVAPADVAAVPADTASAASDTTAAAPALVALTPIRVDTPGFPTIGIVPDVSYVPAVSFGDRPRDQLDEGARLTGEGLDHLKSKRFNEAIEAFTKALDNTPGSVVARYNLARAFARKGDSRAEAVLSQLAAAGCEECLEVVAKAPKDRDLASLARDPEVLAMAAAAQQRLENGGLTRFLLALAPASPATLDAPHVVWTSLAKGPAFLLGDRLALWWEEPATVREVDIVEPPGGCLALAGYLVSAADEAPQEVGPDGVLARPITASSLTITLYATSAGVPCDQRTVRVVVRGHQPPVPAPSPTPEPPREAPAATALTFSKDSAELAPIGFPATSGDGRYAAALLARGGPGSSDARLELVVFEVGTGQAQLTVPLRGPDLDVSGLEARAQAATKELAALSATWVPMLPAGGGDGGARASGLVANVFVQLADGTLRVMDREGNLIAHDQPAKNPKWLPRASGANARDVRLDGAWSDAAGQILVFGLRRVTGSAREAPELELHALKLTR